MKKRAGLAILLGSLFFGIESVDASLITIRPTGEVVWNVLGESTEKSLITERPDLIIGPNNLSQGANAKEIILSSVDGNVNVEIDEEQTIIDPGKLKEDIIEIEERPKVRKISISLVNDKFAIKQPGANAVTSYPVVVNTKEGSLMVKTQTGERNVYVMPLSAVQSLIRSKAIDQYVREESFILEEAKEGQLTYKINGQRVINLFNLYQYKVPVAGVVSAITGEVVSIEQPSWLKVFNFLFT